MTLATLPALTESWSSTYSVSRSRAFSVRVIRVWTIEGTTGGASLPARCAAGDLPLAAAVGAATARPAMIATGSSALRDFMRRGSFVFGRRVRRYGPNAGARVSGEPQGGRGGPRVPRDRS